MLEDASRHFTPRGPKPRAHRRVHQYFIGNAQLLRKLQTVERALASNAKIVIPAGTELVNVIGELAGVLALEVSRSRAMVSTPAASPSTMTEESALV